MIRIHKNSSDVPAILKKRGKKETESLCRAYDAGEREFSLNRNIYAARSVKDKLKKIQHGKCCFCESKFLETAHGDVEHFRPKSGYRQNKGEKLTKPGYYWLAYEWSNLFFCCQLCNQNKENLFPLQNKAKRAKNHHQDISFEKPMLINPSSLNPEDYISFRKEISYAIDDNEIGRQTIEALKLNRSELSKSRSGLLEKVQTLYFLINTYEVTPEGREKIEKLIAKYAEYEEVYSAMIRAAIASDFDWRI